VGIALGSRAAPAAREAADVVVADDRIETVVSAVVEGRILWSSVRDALAVLLGGNLGEVGFTLGSGLVGGTGLTPRQLLLVNLLTDVVPALVLASRPPAGSSPQALLAEGPEASLGDALRRDIKIRAATTAGSAGTAWLLARLTGTPARASTVALVSMVSAQLGQTLVAGRFDPKVAAACFASLAVLAAAVQTPGLSRLMGSRPLGPVGWSIALGTAAASTGIAWSIERR
jgi:cation-transporting ATPase I